MAHKILLADDSKTIQQAAKRVLAGEKDLVLSLASDGRLALEQIILQKPDLVLADHSLPHKNPYELALALADNPDTARIPVIALTSKAKPYDVEKAKSAGTAGYITKPFNSEQFLKGVHGALKPLKKQGQEAEPLTSLPLTPGPAAAEKPAPGAAIAKETVEKIAREVIEEVVWEIVPQLAETLIKEEIERLTKSE